MRTRVKLILLLAIVCIINSCSIVKHTIYLGQGENHTDGFIDTVHFETNYGLPIVFLSINGSEEHYKFLFDMGATTTIISSELSEKLELEPVYHFKSTDSQGKTIKHEYVKIDSLKIGNTKFYGFVAGETIYPENSILRCVLPDGIIGANIMKGLIWQIDYENERIIFSDDLKNYNILDKTPIIRMSRKPPSSCPYITVSKNGEKIRGLIFDTGSNGGISIPLSKKNNYELSVKLIDQSTQGLFGAGADTVYISDNQTINIGSIEMDNVPVEYNYRGKKNIGNAFLNNFLVTADFQSRNIYLDPNQTIAFDRKDFFGYGFSCSIVDSSVIVSSLYENSPAELAGIQINDTIAILNNLPINSYFDNYCGFYTWLYEFRKSNEPITIRIKGKDETISMTPGDYIKND